MTSSEILEYYGAGQEEHRLTSSLGRLERIRTWEILERFLPAPPSRVMDVGGGTGVYALPMAAAGYHVDPYISRFASMCDGFQHEILRDPSFAAIVDGDLTDGQHRNPTSRPDWFTTAYFHRPEEIAPELEAAGFDASSVEGPAWIIPDLNNWLDESTAREQLLEVLRRVEAESSLLGASAHARYRAQGPIDRLKRRNRGPAKSI